MKEITVRTKLLGAIGYPINATRSPLLMNSISEKIGDDFVYFPLSIPPEQFDAAVRGLRALGAGGFNVTMPYKKEIMKYLDSISDEAKALGSVNTVHLKDGKMLGYNTDYFGFEQALLKAGVEIKGKKSLLIGSGGVSGPACFTLVKHGAAHIHIVNRTLEKAEKRALLTNKMLNGICTFSRMSREELTNQIEQNDLIINITPVGMAVNNVKDHDFDYDVLTGSKTVFDVLYVPLKTPLLEEAEKRGCRIINGLQMFLYQAKMSYEIWSGHGIPDEIIRDMTEMITRNVEESLVKDSL